MYILCNTEMDGIPETKKPHVPAICKLHEHSRGWIFRNKQTSAPVFVLHNVYIFTIISIYISLQLADIIRSTGIRCLAMLQTLATRLRKPRKSYASISPSCFSSSLHHCHGTRQQQIFWQRKRKFDLLFLPNYSKSSKRNKKSQKPSNSNCTFALTFSLEQFDHLH